ncbi:ATP-binding cassette domain-containing protein [Sphingobacterium sp. lm-10]|uniref:ABC transporter ATP-binding protein n=1 Tax=Sphingobacterium sp. lm-10 TaxID=2944904 RepID=UPI002021F76F|nr:ATP-binding cassette domain-containing protein [Sphingobacterium sp. lm-10]MCL7988318.1 ATP-binding cassette domain-containing protein [Sphingobacterium sp. lm-10]
MNITLHDIGRRYNREWIFRHLSYTFSAGKRYAILGPNGSGKSTLIKLLTGSLSASEGTVQYQPELQQACSIDEVYQYLTIAAPYMELVEEFSLSELIDFHFQHKNYLPGYDKESLLRLSQLEDARDKEIKHFSSGMKQRLKLVLACCSASDLVFLDEPTSNLDVHGENWYLDLVEQTIGIERILIIGSNQPKEYAFCDEHLDIQNYKLFK